MHSSGRCNSDCVSGCHWIFDSCFLGGNSYTSTYRSSHGYYRGDLLMDQYVTYDGKSERAVQARFSRKITKLWRVLLLVATVGLLVSGAVLIVLDYPIGWLICGFAAPFYMLYDWWAGHLHHLPTPQNSQSIDARLSGDVLGQLGTHPTPKEIAVAASQVQGGFFFSLRFGVTANFLKNITSDDPA